MLDTRFTFQSIAVRTLGPINNSAVKFLSNLGRKISLELGDDTEAGFFTALHGMQTRYSEEKAVRPSVRLSVRPSIRLSVKCANCDETEERSVRFLYHTKKHLP